MTTATIEFSNSPLAVSMFTIGYEATASNEETVVAPANANRKYLKIHNPGTNPVRYCFGTTATELNSILLAPGASDTYDGLAVLSSIHGLFGAAGDQLVVVFGEAS